MSDLQRYAIGYNTKEEKLAILDVLKAHNRRIKELAAMDEWQVTDEMRQEVGEEFVNFEMAEFKPSQIYERGMQRCWFWRANF